MIVLIGIWRSLTKKDLVESARYEIEIFLYFYPSFSFFFQGSESRFFLSGSGFLPYPDPDSEKKVWSESGSGKKTDPKHWSKSSYHVPLIDIIVPVHLYFKFYRRLLTTASLLLWKNQTCMFNFLLRRSSRLLFLAHGPFFSTSKVSNS